MLARLTVTLGTIVAATAANTSACLDVTRAQPPGRPTAAVAELSCAPWDGPAFEVRLPLDPSAPTPQVRIAIWRSPDIGTPSVFQFPDATQELGVAQVQHDDGTFEPLSGTVSFGPLRIDQPVTGSLRLIRARGGAAIERTFRAAWMPRQFLCG